MNIHFFSRYVDINLAGGLITGGKSKYWDKFFQQYSKFHIIRPPTSPPTHLPTHSFVWPSAVSPAPYTRPSTKASGRQVASCATHFMSLVFSTVQFKRCLLHYGVMRWFCDSRRHQELYLAKANKPNTGFQGELRLLHEEKKILFNDKSGRWVHYMNIYGIRAAGTPYVFLSTTGSVELAPIHGHVKSQHCENLCCNMQV